MAPAELHECLLRTTHALAADPSRPRHQKTIIGALLWRYINPEDPELVRAAGETLDAYLETELAVAPADVKVGAVVPFSLKYKLEGVSLALRRTRRAATAKTLLSALIWRYVQPDSVDTLQALLAEYDAVTRPVPSPLG
jgi:hypothetical protein